MRVFLPAVAISLLLAACGSDDGGQAASLEGTTWVLDAASMGELMDPVPADARVDLTFEDDQAGGTSGCNSYRGEYTVDGDSLSFGPLAATQMACEQPLMDLEAAYLAALADVSGFEVDAGGDLILTGGEVSLSYVAEPPPEPLPLTGTEWTLTTIASGDAVSSTIAETEVTAVFAEDGTVAGTDGCNRYVAEYSVSDGSMTIGDLAGTMMACEPDVAAQAQDVADAMAATASYEIDGSSLSLFDGDGDLLLVFEGAG